MPEILEYTFMQRALAGGLLVALVSSFYGPFIVQRQLAFLGSGLAHAAFGGVALGMLLEQDPLLVAIPFTVAVAAGIVWVRTHTALAADTAVGIFFSLAMALGVIFLFWRETNSSDAFTYLFGSILALTRQDLFLCAGAFLANLALLPLWGRWAYATFDRNLARADGHPVLRDEYLLSIAVAVVTVIAIKIVGILLMSAFLVIPAATARLLAHRFIHMMVYTLAINVTGVLAGLAASYYSDLPSGPAIILVQAALFGAALLHARLRKA
ncbi:MAG: metal ABC transporter permease [Candidatus Hydrogenedentes bacterium]|nr:metal ABC transporter permease [Candidatus Hydrogenedentota bacterium]